MRRWPSSTNASAYEVRYSRRALSQLASVYEYLCERNHAGASRVTESIRATVARLEELPRLGRATDEGGVHLIIEPEYLYRVFYRIDRDGVLVIRILHGRQG